LELALILEQPANECDLYCDKPYEINTKGDVKANNSGGKPSKIIPSCMSLRKE
jgi:hypothetical protein